MSALADLKDRVAVVTGGASGIGRGIAQCLIAEGMQVVIADIEEPALLQTAAAIGATPLRTDVASAASVLALAEEVSRRFGTVDLVCNNAGVGSVSRIEDMQIADWNWLLNVNLYGVIHGISAFLPRLKANPRGGHMVNTASLAGLATLSGLGGYAVTKFAIVALSESLALELEEEGSKVGVTVLCPGTVSTNIGRSSRNRPGNLLGGALHDVDLQATESGAQMRWVQPTEVGEILVRAVKRGDLYAFTHPEMADPVLQRHQRIAAQMARRD